MQAFTLPSWGMEPSGVGTLAPAVCVGSMQREHLSLPPGFETEVLSSCCTLRFWANLRCKEAQRIWEVPGGRPPSS